MNTTQVSTNNGYCSCPSERIAIDNGIPANNNNNNATKQFNRSRSITAFAACLLLAGTACVLFGSFSESGRDLRRSTTSLENHLATGAHYMDCGTAPLCGVLALETGYGKGYYKHKTPSVHGLWPETGKYGSSQCLPPKSTSDPANIHYCYDDDGDTIIHEKWFENHEWEKHGVCAGASDADAYFEMVCNLSKAPLAVMTKARNEQPSSDKSLDDFVQALESAGYSIFYGDYQYEQILLSACASKDGDWIIADVSEFSAVCGGGSNSNEVLSE